MFEKKEDSTWMSISDLMSGLMIVFMLIAICHEIYLMENDPDNLMEQIFNLRQDKRSLQTQMEYLQQERDSLQQDKNQLQSNISILRNDLYRFRNILQQHGIPLEESLDARTIIYETLLHDALVKEFRYDLSLWNASIDGLTITFDDPEMVFGLGSVDISPKFKSVLIEFFPRYLSLLYSSYGGKFRDNIEEIRIEGHTSSEWKNFSIEEAYFRNMELSQARTRSALDFCYRTIEDPQMKLFVRSLVTANGLSSSQPIRRADGSEDMDKSRRVVFRIRTKEKNLILQRSMQ